MTAETQVKANLPLEVLDSLSLHTSDICGLINCLSCVVDAVEEDHRGESTVIALRYLELELRERISNLEAAVKAVAGSGRYPDTSSAKQEHMHA